MMRSDNKVQIIDFGHSEILPRPEVRPMIYCGTPYYMPPEFINKQYFDSKSYQYI